MLMHSTETMVTFNHSFVLTAVDGVQPSGTYRLITEEEQIPGLSFVAYQRRATMLQFPAGLVPGQSRYVVQVDPVELSAALAADAARFLRVQ